MKNKVYFNFFIFIPLLFSIFNCFGCSKEKTADTATVLADTIHYRVADTIIKKDTIVSSDTSKPGADAKFLALGDSYTIGQSVADSERFPAQTAQYLKNENIPVKDPEYIAVTGWTTLNLMSGIEYKNPAKNYDIVTLLIGVNDQYQGMNISDYATHFQQLLNTSIELAGNRKRHVFVLSIPDYSATPFVDPSKKAQVSKEIDAFNAVNKQITQQYNIAYIDITPSTRLAATDPSLIANDGLHPSGKEYKVWANLLAPVIKHVLK